MQAPNDGDDFGTRYDALHDVNVQRTCIMLAREGVAPKREPLHVVTRKFDLIRAAVNR